MLRSLFRVVALCSFIVTVVPQAMAQSDIEDRALEIANALGVGDVWLECEHSARETPLGGVKLESSSFTMSFAGSERVFNIFRWDERLLAARGREQIAGRSNFYAPGLATQRALEMMSLLVDDPEAWSPATIQDVAESPSGPEFGGLVNVKLERRVNGLLVMGDLASFKFDQVDGRTVAVTLARRSAFRHETRGETLTEVEAESKARSHLLGYLTRKFSSEIASEIETGLARTEDVTVTLAYGPIDRGLDSRSAEFLDEKVIPVVYTVDFGNAQVFVSATTGKCVGGRLDIEHTGPRKETTLKVSSPTTRSDRDEGGTPVLLYGLIGIAVVGAAVALAVKRTR